MLILALDLGTRTGFALGVAGRTPESSSVTLKKPSEAHEVAARNLARFLRDHTTGRRPDLIAVEHYQQPGGQPSDAAVISSLLLAGALHGFAGTHDIQIEAPYPSSIRKHFLGRANFGDRKVTNQAVVARSVALRYLPVGCDDWDRANACAVFDYACAHYARRLPTLVLLGAAA